jgi:Zn-dependent peptidase ImmA (M78 family)
MALVLSPEIKMARKIIRKHSLVVPFDLDELVKQYAKITYMEIPVDGVDGVCLNLKAVKKNPTVIINENSARTRQKFTLAHELGHIIIPWHIGTFIDDADENAASTDTLYWQMESEANRFASELLMPFDWIFSLYQKNPETQFLISQICRHCGVSEQAASIRLSNAIEEIEHFLIPEDWILELYNKNDDLALLQKTIVQKTMLHPKRVAMNIVQRLPGKIAFCMESEQIVMGCGATREAHLYYQIEGEEFFENPYPYFQKFFKYEQEGLNTHWWILNTNFEIPNDDRSWRDILEKIANEISPTQGSTAFKNTVNAKLSGVNGNWKRKNPGLGVNDFIEDAIQRFNNPDFEDFISHKDFLAFIRKRSEAFFQ